MAGADLRLIGPGGKRLYPSVDLASCTNGAFLSAHQPAHSSQREASCQTREMYLESLERGHTFNWLSCCVPIINHTGPVRRIRWRGIGRPRGVWFLRPLPTSDHRLHLSLDDKNSRLIADENYLLRHHNGKSTELGSVYCIAIPDSPR